MCRVICLTYSLAPAPWWLVQRLTWCRGHGRGELGRAHHHREPGSLSVKFWMIYEQLMMDTNQ